MENFWGIASTVLGLLATIVALSGNTFNAPLTSARLNWRKVLTPRGWFASFLLVVSIVAYVAGVVRRNDAFRLAEETALTERTQLTSQISEARAENERRQDEHALEIQSLNQQIAQQSLEAEESAAQLQELSAENNRLALENLRLSEEIRYLVGNPGIAFVPGIEGENYSILVLRKAGRLAVSEAEADDYAIFRVTIRRSVDGAVRSVTESYRVGDMLQHVSGDLYGEVIRRWDLDSANQQLNQIREQALARLSLEDPRAIADVDITLAFCTKVLAVDQNNEQYMYHAVVSANRVGSFFVLTGQ